ncbi:MULTISPECIES: metalloregulator ArsR/SmtB family transcription factor [unclassified Rhizobium]|uniref:Metalloregulator ArsR/SmtB family transcription factor n=2 Tax=Rhizobium rhododendri TaxID=2506430 RepID=A0ABY8IQF1_9HYPH|nr:MULTISPECIES: metalloregulator ArsR/SmtB family transcription factor [Rhizobium]TQX86014.1 transcriptional regulator [Rhizobium sp. rho-13.1]TQY10978.1 transcriptional regulator [Rhizobium sp. rho-1.1]WFS25809.1 metalloregulator ArsR/SmtB family transcription factor [Rhizobium rhododendri]
MANQTMALNSVFHALADPTRRAVIQRLTKGPATVSELAEPFDMALPSFVKHIAVLEESHLIVSRKQGRIRTCSLESGNFVAAERWFDDIRAQWESRYENLDNLLLTLKGDKNDV